MGVARKARLLRGGEQEEVVTDGRAEKLMRNHKNSGNGNQLPTRDNFPTKL